MSCHAVTLSNNSNTKQLKVILLLCNTLELAQAKGPEAQIIETQALHCGLNTASAISL